MPVPVVAATERVTEHAILSRFSRGHLAILMLILGAALAFVWSGVRASPGGGVKVPARATEDVPPFTPPPTHPVVGVEQHLRGFIYMPHRYPRVCGQEITAVINGGQATLRLPHEKDMDWLTRPPSEASL